MGIKKDESEEQYIKLVNMIKNIVIEWLEDVLENHKDKLKLKLGIISDVDTNPVEELNKLKSLLFI